MFKDNLKDLVDIVANIIAIAAPVFTSLWLIYRKFNTVMAGQSKNEARILQNREEIRALRISHIALYDRFVKRKERLQLVFDTIKGDYVKTKTHIEDLYLRIYTLETQLNYLLRKLNVKVPDSARSYDDWKRLNVPSWDTMNELDNFEPMDYDISSQIQSGHLTQSDHD